MLNENYTMKNVNKNTIIKELSQINIWQMMKSKSKMGQLVDFQSGKMVKLDQFKKKKG